VGNALKFTERGSVRLGVALDALDPSCLRFVVRDTGMGIEAAVQRRLFTPFTQADASTTRRFGGTGLGLSIVKHIAELMGGGIDVRSQPGEGSEFIVTMPVRVDGAGDRGGVRLLALGFTVTSALTDAAATLGWQIECLPPDAGPDGLRQRLAQGDTPDALVVDPSGVHDLRSLIASMDVEPERLPPCLAIEPDHVNAARLFNELSAARHLQGADPETLLDGTRLDAAGLRWLAGLRVLVVDDGAINLEVARRLLERQGAQAEICEAATLALHRLDGAPTAFDAVLMDVQMPGLDGNEAVRRLRADPRFAGLPVIALSAGTLVAERQRALESGMDDFLAKPLDPPALARTLRRHVAHSQGCAPVVAECQEARTRTQWPPLEALDTSSIVERFGQDRHFYARMMRHLLDDYGEMGRVTPVVPLDSPSRALLRARMHKLRGCAGALGAPEIQQLAATLEARLTVDDGGLGLETLLTRLSTAIGVLESGFEAWVVSLPPAEAPAPDVHVQAGEAHDRLRQLLQEQDMEALSWVRQCSGSLRGALGRARHDDLVASIGRLDFRRALDVLDGAGQAQGIEGATSR
jgi:CheY-like chemotaxis protein/HPt (histidine-containing phosphotransfer) domain-containing protein